MGPPTFLGPLIALATPPTPSHEDQLGGRPPSAGKLAMVVQKQTQTNWCWAATSTSVSLFFDSGSRWTQCKVANTTLGKSDCCGSGANGHCNVPYYLDDALTTTGNFDRFATGTEDFSSVQEEINRNRPLCIRVGWFGGGGHFLCIVGWIEAASGTSYYDLSDPIYGDSQVALATLGGSYQGSGTWSHSYFVRSTSTGGLAAASTRAPGTMGA